jgi:hypothetical protein
MTAARRFSEKEIKGINAGDITSSPFGYLASSARFVLLMVKHITNEGCDFLTRHHRVQFQ